ncbi:MAG: hypothetical protein RR523_04745 [Cetobacterium sp.]|uniref:hypothetical protein n=1 Tax=Cetobacterium sp. TaxID=2071632 RepID=UPI002FCB4480
MKKSIVIIALVLFRNIFANSQNDNLNEFRERLTEEQQIVFDKIFDTNEKLIDSYKIDLKYLNSSDINYEKTLKNIEIKIEELENFKFFELKKLRKDLIENPERYKNQID